MAYYEYFCKECRVLMAVIHKMDETFEGKCDYCGSSGISNWEQHIFPPALQFKGSGFYETDYKKKPQGNL